MTLLTTVIGRGATGAKPAAASVPAGSLYFDTTLSKMQRSTGAAWEDCEAVAGAGVGDVTYTQLLAMQITNEIKGWPPIVQPTADLDALNLWWDKVGTPSTAPSVEDVAGEAGITETYELCLKVVADGANEGLSQRFTYADEPRIKSGRTVSALVAIWSVGGISITAKLVNSDASETAAAAVTAAAWSVVEVPAHVCAGTYVDLQVTAGAAGTFYVVPLGMNIGARGLPLKPRGSRYVAIARADVVSGVDPGGAAFTDVDVTANTSPLTNAVHMEGSYNNETTAGKFLEVRRNGDTDATGNVITRAPVVLVTFGGNRILPVDDGQIFEYKTNGAGADVEHVSITLVGFWEWE